MFRLVLAVSILVSGTALADTAAVEGGSSPADVWAQSKASPGNQRAQLLLLHPQSRRAMIGKMLRGSEMVIKYSPSGEAARAGFAAVCKQHGINLKKVPKGGIMMSKPKRKKLKMLLKRVKDPVQCLLDMMDWMKSNSRASKTMLPSGELQNIKQGPVKATGMGSYHAGNRGEAKILHFRKLRGRWYFFEPEL